MDRDKRRRLSLGVGAMALALGVVALGVFIIASFFSGSSAERSTVKKSGGSDTAPPRGEGDLQGGEGDQNGGDRNGGDQKGGDSGIAEDRTRPEGVTPGDPTIRDEVIQVGIIQREYLTVSPSWADQVESIPLVVVLHGLTVDRFAMLDFVDWRRAVEERGFVALFPQGFGNSWNVGPCCPPSNLVQVDDMAFIDSVIAATKNRHDIDQRRVFVTGFSAGALMAYRYGCERSDQLAGIGPIAGVNLTGCTPSRPLSLIHQHSDPDLVVPFDGSLGVGQILSSEPLPPVTAGVAKWAKSSGCAQSNDWRQVTPRVDERTWVGCDADAKVRLVRLSGVGHEWPSVPGYDGLDMMLDFFGIR